MGKAVTMDRRGMAIGWYLAGWTQMKIASKLNVAQSSVSNWIRRYKSDPNKNVPKVLPRSGRPKKITAANIATVRRSVARNPTQSANQIRLNNPSLHHLTRKSINDILVKKLKLPARVRVKKPGLTPRMMDDR